MTFEHLYLGLDVMWQGMAGIFIVTAVIILGITILAKLPEKEKTQPEGQHRGNL